MTTPFQRTKNLFQQALPLHTLSRDLKILFISNLFASFGDGLIIFLLPVFIRDLHATEVDVGFLFSILTVASAVTIIPGGLLADKYDRKKILMLGWAIWVPVPLFFVFATHWTQLTPAMFLYGVLISGPASSAYIVGRAQKSKMASTFTILVSAWGIGYTFAPTVSGYLAETVGIQPIFLLTALFYFITLVTVAQISSQHPKKTEDPTQKAQVPSNVATLQYRSIFFLAILFAAVMFLLALIFPLVPLFLEDVYKYNTAQIGILGSFTYFGGSTLSLVVGKIGDKYGKTTGVSFAMILVAIALSIFASFNNYIVLMFASFLRGASFPMWAFIGATVGSIVPSASRARWISVVQTIVQVASILAPYIGGILYAGSPQTPFLITIAASLMLSSLALIKPFKE